MARRGALILSDSEGADSGHRGWSVSRRVRPPPRPAHPVAAQDQQFGRPQAQAGATGVCAEVDASEYREATFLRQRLEPIWFTFSPTFKIEVQVTLTVTTSTLPAGP